MSFADEWEAEEVVCGLVDELVASAEAEVRAKELKAAVVWSMAGVLVGSSERGIEQLESELVRSLCAGPLGLAGLLGCGDALPDPASVTFRRPHLRYDGTTLTRTELALTAKDVRDFWDFLDAFPVAERRDWRRLPAAARLAREMMGMAQLARLEMVLSRMAMQLAATLQPIVWPRVAKGQEGDGPAVPRGGGDRFV